MNRISPNAETGAVGTTYYIHSTVLGSELGKVGYDSNGSMVSRDTSIFAGGAIIAEQQKIGTSENVVYTHADPVTGSIQKTDQAGIAMTGKGAFEEYEPLGQSVRTTPPVSEAPPPNPAPVINDSLFPEWQ